MHIKALTLYTSQIEKQCRFYGEVLGLQVRQVSDGSYRFRLGETFVRLQAAPNAQPYHFAINIPHNQSKAALAWLKERVEVLTFEGHEIQDFSNWQADAIYFYDEDQNIVELIARRTLANASEDTFGPHSMLEVSEIGMPTLNIEAKYHLILAQLGLPIYDGSFERFCAIGDEHGLFICIDKSKKKWFPTNDEAWSANFEALIDNGAHTFSVSFQDDKLLIED
ncbi:MAG: VOC family protein [Bacteroidota bacterium]